MSIQRVAVALGPGLDTVSKGMFGTARWFGICEVEGDHARCVEVRENPYANTQQHGKTLDVWAEVDDCSILVACHIGARGVKRLQARGVRLVFASKSQTVLEVLREHFGVVSIASSGFGGLTQLP
jgi:predicted Fe-Mo cluster-binding NifX family protein